MTHHDATLKVAFFGFVIAFTAVCVVLALAETPQSAGQLFGKIESCESGLIRLDGQTIYFSENTQVYSQGHKHLSASAIRPNQEAQIAYIIDDGRRLAQKIKLLDRPSREAHKRFAGRIMAVDQQALRLADKTFFVDDFTIRLGNRMQDANLEKWVGANVTIIAVENDARQFVAEVVTEGLDLSALAVSK